MLELRLVNMPFASLHLPSFALTQLEAVVRAEFEGRVSVKVCYLNHDCAHYLGLDLYKYVSVISKGVWIGEWFFRQAAFPELADNTEEYFRRFYPRQDERTRALKRVVQEKRQGAEGFLDELIDKYALDQAGIVGFTSSYLQNLACLAMARKLKERNPGLITVMGGANCEAPMGDALVKNAEPIDFVFSGPGLKSLVQFIGHCLNQELGKCHAIAGVFSRQNRVAWPPEAIPSSKPDTGEHAYVSPIGEELDINTPIELDYDAFLDTHARNFPNGEVSTVLLFETSRGCWWGERSRCTFCGLNGMNMCYRAMAPERAIQQFQAMFARYAARCRYFWAVDNIMPKDYPQQVFARLETPPEVVIGYHTRADLSEQDLEALAKAGVKSLQPGIESLDTPTLKLIGKGSTAFGNLRFLKHCVMQDVYPFWNILLGFPGQDPQVAEAAYRKYVHDIPLLVHLPPPIGAFPIRIDRYSHYFFSAEQYGLDLHPMEFYALIYPFDEAVLSDLVYGFVDERNFKADYFKTALKWVGKITRQVELWWSRWHGPDASIPPRLFARSSIVYDSRSGEVIEHPVGDIGRHVLECLARPKSIAELAVQMKPWPAFDAERQVKRLQEQGLLFQEGDQYMSLVFPQEPPPLPRLPQGQPRLELLATLFPNIPLAADRVIEPG